jgi:hypothetical protein
MATIKARPLSPYDKEMLKRQQATWKQENALTQQRMSQAQQGWESQNAYNLAQSNQYLQNAETGYGQNIANLKTNTANAALNMGNARGSWSRDYVDKSPERIGLETGMSQAKQSYADQLQQLEMQKQGQGFDWANMVAQFNLTKQGQADQLYGMTHYSPSGGRAKAPNAPGAPVQPDYTGVLGKYKAQYGNTPLANVKAQAEYKQLMAQYKAAFAKWQNDYRTWESKYGG